MSIGTPAFAQSVPDQAPQTDPQGGQGRDGQGARAEAGYTQFGGGTYDNEVMQDDWYYDTYTSKKGFGSDFMQGSNLQGAYVGAADENDWFFDSYEMKGGMRGNPRPGVGGGRQGQNQGGLGAQGQGGQQGAQGQGKENISLAGTIAGIKEVEVIGQQPGAGTHSVVLLEDGDMRYVVDLGPAQAFSGIPLELGTQISVEGVLGRVGPRTVLFADQLITQGQDPLNIQQDLKLDSQPLPRQPARAQDFNGEILRLKEVRLENGMSHTIALVATENQGAMPIDLGPADKFATFDIQEGDTLNANGQVVPVGEYLVVWADQLDVKGEPVDLRGLSNQGGGRPRGTR